MNEPLPYMHAGMRRGCRETLQRARFTISRCHCLFKRLTISVSPTKYLHAFVVRALFIVAFFYFNAIERTSGAVRDPAARTFQFFFSSSSSFFHRGNTQNEGR